MFLGVRGSGLASAYQAGVSCRNSHKEPVVRESVETFPKLAVKTGDVMVLPPPPPLLLSSPRGRWAFLSMLQTCFPLSRPGAQGVIQPLHLLPMTFLPAPQTMVGGRIIVVEQMDC